MTKMVRALCALALSATAFGAFLALEPAWDSAPTGVVVAEPAWDSEQAGAVALLEPAWD